jgi:DNA-binding NarL/FixJ family response regulator
MKIVIVDDSVAIRERLKHMLAEVDSIEIVGEAASAVEGAILTEAACPDVVILDISMPGGSGLEVLSRIKQCPRPPFVAVLTNHPYEPYRKRSRALGADFFFDKSQEFYRLLATLATLAASGGAERPARWPSANPRGT